MLISLEDVKNTLLKNIKESLQDDNVDCANIDELVIVRNRFGMINLFIFHDNDLSIDLESLIKKWFSYTLADKKFNFEEWLDGYYVNDNEMDELYEDVRRPENKIINKIYWYEESFTYEYWKKGKKSKTNPKIITFHSNKSCMGVSTLCAATAIELVRSWKKVVIIDADFDTHGLTQLFNPYGEYDYCNGFLDFLIYPSESLINTKKDLFLSAFYWNFFIRGNIDGLFVMPSVKTTNSDINQKLDKCPCAWLVNKKIELLIALIKNTINPDYILFDLQTGISDIGGITSCLSDYHCFVGGEDRQSRIGIKFLIKHVLKRTKKDDIYESNMFFIQSPQSKLDSLSNKFNDMVNDALMDVGIDKLDTKYLLKMPYIANLRECLNDTWITGEPSLIDNSYKEITHKLKEVLNDY